jgi:hypothetical protein
MPECRLRDCTTTQLPRAGQRLPFGVPDPVLCGGSAVELCTGTPWPAADLEVAVSDPRRLISELFAVGFRWFDRPRHAERGLWHSEFETGIDIIEAARHPASRSSQTRFWGFLISTHHDQRMRPR